MHSDLPIKQDEYFNHRRPSLRKRYLMKTSLACTPYSACLWQWMLRFKAASAWWLYRMSEESAFLPLLGRLPPPSPVPQTARDGPVFHSLSAHLWLSVPRLCYCDYSEPLGPERVLNSPVLHSQQPWLYVTAFLTSDQSRLPNHTQPQEKHPGKPPEAFWFSARVSEVPGRIAFRVFISASAPR